MTAPSPGEPSSPDYGSSGGGGGIGAAFENVRYMNKWVLFAIVALIALAVWWFFYHRPEQSSDKVGDSEVSWEARARQMLLDRGYNQWEVDSALQHYLYGGQMSVQDQALISVAIRSLGTPDFPNQQPNNNPASPWNQIPSTPTGPVDNGNTGVGVDGGNTVDTQSGFWYVTSTGFGPTSSLRGIAQQYYGSANMAVNLLPFNPDISTVNERIPPGKVVTVPRSLNV